MVKSYGLPLDHYDAAISVSGLAAIATCLTTLLRFKKDTVIMISDEMYFETPDTALYIAESVIKVDVTNNQMVLDTVKNNHIDIFLFESCSNPTGKMLDFEILQEFPTDTIIICDNTWLTSQLFNPFDHGVHVVVESLTKYISGGLCIGGMIISDKQFMLNIHDFNDVFGQFIGSDHCKLYLDGLRTMPKRVKTVSETATTIANLLDQFDNIKVVYPMLSSHQSHHIATKYLITKNGPGCIFIIIDNNNNNSVGNILNKITKSKYLINQTSFGSEKSKITKPKLIDGKIHFRLAIGYNIINENLNEYIDGIVNTILSFI